MKKSLKICALSLAGLLFVSSLASCSNDSPLKDELNATDASKLDFSALVNDDYDVDVTGNFSSSVLTTTTDDSSSKKITVIIELDGETEADQYLEHAKKYANVGTYSNSRVGITQTNKLIKSQANLANGLLEEGLITKIKGNYTVLIDGFSAETTIGNLSDIRNYPGVSSVTVCGSYELPETVTVSTDDGSSEEGNTIACDSDTGIADNDTVYQGEGMVVAVLDSGLDYTHPAFQNEVAKENQTITKEIVAEKLASSDAKSAYDAAHSRELTTDDVYLSSKIPFAYDYADNDSDVLPAESDHGTHVSGIILGYDENYQRPTYEDCKISYTGSVFSGVTPKAQLVSMKVFADEEESASDDVILKALEDAALLNVDAINESLGSLCGFSEESELDEEYSELNKKTNAIHKKINELGITLVASAGNSYYQQYSAADGSNLVTNPESDTTGSPGTYTTSFTIASVERKPVQYLVSGDTKFAFTEASDNKSEDYHFIEMSFRKHYNDEMQEMTDEQKTAFITNKMESESLTLEYVSIGGIGSDDDFKAYKSEHGEDSIRGKIALIQRGTSTFESKIATAKSYGAVGAIIYNNVSGTIRMTCGDSLTFPACSISHKIGAQLAASASGTIVLNNNNYFGPFMSDFSSLGCNPDLTLKPEITSCGGEVLSSVIGGGYEEFSGTSMSAPNISGIVLAVKQYVKANFQAVTGIDPTTLSSVELKKKIANTAEQLIMSTAYLADDEFGNVYSPRKQGAGIASVQNCIDATAYIHMGDDEKAKIELGDDKEKTGEYELTFNVRNNSSEAATYTVKDTVLTETSSGQPTSQYASATVENTSYGLNNSKVITGANGVTVNGDKITVPANTDGEVTVKIVLSDEDKKYIDDTFPNGMYVEGFIRLVPEKENSVELGFPFLGFYGDWLQAPVWDKSYYDVQSEDYNDDDVKTIDKEHAALKEQIIYGHYGDFYIIPLGGYVYDIEKNSGYEKILATEERAAISIDENAIDQLYTISGGLLRSAKSVTCTITDAETGEVYFTKTTYNNRKDAYYSNAGTIYGWSGEYDFKPDMIANNTKCVVTLTATLDYEGGDDLGENGTRTYTFYVDYEAPSLQDVQYYKILDSVTGEYRYYIDVTVYDNRYAMSIMPAIIEANYDTSSSYKYKLTSIDDNIPLYQSEAGTTTTTRIEITKYMDTIANSAYPDTLFLYLDDYAMNYSLYKIPLNSSQCTDLTFKQDTITISENQVIDLADYVNFDSAMMEGFTWTNNSTTVCEVNYGQVIGLKKGIATIYGTTSYGAKISVKIKVLGEGMEGYEKYDVSTPDEISVNSYTTLLTFDDDGYMSHIGDTGSTHYDMDDIIKMYVGEKIQLNTIIGPWYADTENNECTVEWRINTDVCTIDEDGVLEATSAGSSSIYAYLYINGKKSKGKDSFKVEITDSMVTSGSALMAYKGTEEEVVVPGSQNIKYIYLYAFSLYKYVNVEKTVNGKTEIEIGQEEIGNPYIKRIYLPDAIETIYQYAFAKLTALEEINIPDKTTEIYQGAFYGDTSLKNVDISDNSRCVKILYKAFENCTSLETINLKNVTTIGSEAFKGCTSLTSVDLTNMKYYSSRAFENCTSLTNIIMSKDTAIGDYMFANTGVTELVLDQDYIGEGAFSNCKNLTKVTFTNPNVVIGKNAFKGCTNLTEINFADGGNVTLRTGAFNSTTSLASLTAPDGTLVLGDSVFSGSGLTTLKLKTNTVLTMESTAFIGARSFTSFDASDSTKYSVTNGLLMDGTKIVLAPSGLKSITIPDFATEIGEAAFAGSQATELSLNANITKIDSYAFTNSTFKTIDFNGAENVVIGNNAFYKATSLTTLTGFSASTIGENAFYSTKLSSLEFNANAVVESYAFASMSSLTSVTFKGDAVIKSYAFWKSFSSTAGKVTFADNSNVTIGDYAFAESKLKTINLECATSIGAYAFQSATKLTAANAVNATSIGKYAFTGCTSLATAVISDTLTSLPENVFADCKALKTIDLKNVTSLSNSAFSGCTSLANVDLSKLTSIGDTAFYNAALTEANLTNVTSLGSGVFASNASLTKVTLPASMTTLPSASFNGCSKLATINLDNIKVIEKAALANTSSLKSANLNNVETIADQGLYYSGFASLSLPVCTKLGTLSLAGSPLSEISMPVMEEIGAGAFTSTNFVTIDLPESLTKIEAGAFTGISSLEGFTCANKASFKNSVFTIDNGVLYVVREDNILSLEAYPQSKTGEEYTVLEGTVRIEETSFYGNESLKKVTLPSSLQVIGDGAFYNTPSLTNYVFLSKKAPALEAYYNSSLVSQINSYFNNASFTGTLKDMYELAEWPTYYYYCNFNYYVGFPSDTTLVAEYPANSTGYETYIYEKFFSNIKTSKNNDETVTYTVTFDTDGGNEIAAQTIASGNKVTMPETPVKEGYTFDKWVDADGNEFNFDTAVSANLTLKATYTKNASGKKTNTAAIVAGSIGGGVVVLGGGFTAVWFFIIKKRKFGV